MRQKKVMEWKDGMRINGYPVVDARRPLKGVEVTPVDTRRGRSNDPRKCPSSLAIKRHCDAEDVLTFDSRTYVKKKNENDYKRYETPPAIRAELISLDRGGGFQPGTYNIPTVPSPIKQVMYRKKRQLNIQISNLKSKPRKPRAYRHMSLRGRAFGVDPT
jgi:hypothetical protein